MRPSVSIAITDPALASTNANPHSVAVGADAVQSEVSAASVDTVNTGISLDGSILSAVRCAETWETQTSAKSDIRRTMRVTRSPVVDRRFPVETIPTAPATAK
jgi:hypothetical protein